MDELGEGVPELDILRPDPRFTEMLIRLNLTPNE